MRAANKGKPAIILLVEDDRGDQELTWRALKEGKIRNEQEQTALGYRGPGGFFKDEYALGKDSIRSSLEGLSWCLAYL